MSILDIHRRSLATSTALSVYYTPNMITPLQVISAPGTSMPFATWVSAEIDISFSSDKLKISSLPSLLGAKSAGASAVATPPPLSLPLLPVRFLFAISILSCAPEAVRGWFQYPVN